MNRWGIPQSLEEEVIGRDVNCVYCGITFVDLGGPRRSRASWEHIINDAQIITRENIALCCIGCNASKGAKSLETWLSSRYCVARGITEESVAPVVQAVLGQLRRGRSQAGELTPQVQHP